MNQKEIKFNPLLLKWIVNNFKLFKFSIFFFPIYFRGSLRPFFYSKGIA